MPRPEYGRAEFGLLQCRCSIFPVIDGIPAIQHASVSVYEHTRGGEEIEGPSIDRLVELIRGGRSLMALLECVSVPQLPKTLRSVTGSRLVHSWSLVKLARAFGRHKFFQKVLASRDAIGAREVLEHYYLSGGPLNASVGHYFIRRFGQPRHLAALALAASIPSGEKPILDIACGTGHLEHYFSCRHDPARVVGLDMNFFHLWIARHWMAPEGRYVCANANDGLPFTDDTFSSTICSDAYHYIVSRERLLSEIDRCAPNRFVALTRVGNSAVMPNEGTEQTLQSYLQNFSDVSVRVFDETGLVRGYLRNQDALSTPPKSATDLAECKWLSFVWNPPLQSRPLLDLDTTPPHAVGCLGLNPIYTSRRGPKGESHLNFAFPEVWYAYENHAMLAYCPREATVSADEFTDLPFWKNRMSLRHLVDSFVLIGLPKRFSRGEDSVSLD